MRWFYAFIEHHISSVNNAYRVVVGCWTSTAAQAAGKAPVDTLTIDVQSETDITSDDAISSSDFLSSVINACVACHPDLYHDRPEGHDSRE